MTLTLSTLEAAGLGLAFALPLLACSAAGHSVVGKELFPVLEELHTEQRKLVAPMITGGCVRRAWSSLGGGRRGRRGCGGAAGWLRLRGRLGLVRGGASELPVLQRRPALRRSRAPRAAARTTPQACRWATCRSCLGLWCCRASCSCCPCTRCARRAQGGTYLNPACNSQPIALAARVAANPARRAPPGRALHERPRARPLLIRWVSLSVLIIYSGVLERV